jgi:hypothetical protein
LFHRGDDIELVLNVVDGAVIRKAIEELADNLFGAGLSHVFDSSIAADPLGTHHRRTRDV